MTLPNAPVSTSGRTNAQAAGERAGRRGGGEIDTEASAHSRSSRAVSRNRSSGRPAVFRVRSDRFDDEIEFVGGVDFPATQ